MGYREGTLIPIYDCLFILSPYLRHVHLLTEAELLWAPVMMDASFIYSGRSIAQVTVAFDCEPLVKHIAVCLEGSLTRTNARFVLQHCAWIDELCHKMISLFKQSRRLYWRRWSIHWKGFPWNYSFIPRNVFQILCIMNGNQQIFDIIYGSRDSEILPRTSGFKIY